MGSLSFESKLWEEDFDQLLIFENLIEIDSVFKDKIGDKYQEHIDEYKDRGKVDAALCTGLD